MLRHTRLSTAVTPRRSRCPGGRDHPPSAEARAPARARALRSAVAVLLVLSPLLLAGCSAGQAAQTASQVRDRTGGTGQVGDLTIRAVQLAHPDGGAHEAGDEVELTMAIVNGGAVDDRLVGVTGAGSAVAAVGDPPGAAVAPAAPASSPDLVEAPAPGTRPADRTALDVLLPAGEAVLVGSDVPAVVLSGLDRRIDAAQSVALTLTFARAGEVSVRAVVAPPPDVRPRGPVHDFHDHDARDPHGHVS